MIFLNKGENYRKHECISEDEVQHRYPKMRIREPRLYSDEGRELRKMREKARVTMREMAERSIALRSEIGAPLTLCEICDIEKGLSRLVDIDMVALWKKLIEMKGAKHDSL